MQVRPAASNTSGAIGWGNETGIRLSANYSRHPASAYGDRYDIGLGYQELDDQFLFRTRYQKPLLNRSRQWWDAELTLQFERLDSDTIQVTLDGTKNTFTLKVSSAGAIDEA